VALGIDKKEEVLKPPDFTLVDPRENDKDYNMMKQDVMI
jgi:hypothetical protein